MGKKFTDVEFKEEISSHVAEHELYLRFTNDEDAFDFREWWDDEGNQQFEAYLKEKFNNQRKGSPT